METFQRFKTEIPFSHKLTKLQHSDKNNIHLKSVQVIDIYPLYQQNFFLPQSMTLNFTENDLLDESWASTENCPNFDLQYIVQ